MRHRLLLSTTTNLQHKWPHQTQLQRVLHPSNSTIVLSRLYNISNDIQDEINSNPSDSINKAPQLDGTRQNVKQSLEASTKLSSSTQENCLKNATNSVINQLMQLITEIVEEQSDKNFSLLKQKMESMQLELQEKMTEIINQRCMELQERIPKQRRSSPSQFGQLPQLSASLSSMLKKERKQITQNLMSMSHNSFNAFANRHSAQELGKSFKTEIDEVVDSQMDNSLIVSSLELESKINVMQLEQTKKLNNFYARTEARIEQLYNDIKRITTRNLEMKLMVEEKIEESTAGLESLFRVVGNLESKIDQMEQKLSKLPIKK